MSSQFLRRVQLLGLRRSRPEAGFSLIEMIVIVVMVGILAAIISPSWGRLLSNQRANSSRDQVVQALRNAQSQATRTRVRYKLVLTPGSATSVPTLCITMAAPLNAACTDGEPLGFGSYQPRAISLTSPNTTIFFDEDGNIDLDNTPQGPPFTIVVRSPANVGTARCVEVQTALMALRTLDGGQPGCP